MRNKFKIIYLPLLLEVIVALLFFVRQSSAADCSLTLNSPHGNQIYVGDTVTWRLDSGFYGGHSYWYGTKNGEADVNGLDTSLAAFFTQTFGPYPPESIGHYERFIVVKDLLYQFLCQTAAVTFDVIQQPSPTPESSPNAPPTPTPSTSSGPTATPTPTMVDPSELAKIKDGDLIKTADSPNVWRVKITGDKRYKQWLFGPQLMKANGYSFRVVKMVHKDILDQFEVSYLVSQTRGSGRVYFVDSIVAGSSATKHWIPTYEIFQKYGYAFEAVFYVPRAEINLYTNGNNKAAPSQSQGGVDANNLTANISDILLRFLGRLK